MRYCTVVVVVVVLVSSSNQLSWYFVLQCAVVMRDTRRVLPQLGNGVFLPIACSTNSERMQPRSSAFGESFIWSVPAASSAVIGAFHPPSQFYPGGVVLFMRGALCSASPVYVGRAIPPCLLCPPPTWPRWAATRISKRLSRGNLRLCECLLRLWIRCGFLQTLLFCVDSDVRFLGWACAHTHCPEFPVVFMLSLVRVASLWWW